VTLAAIGLNLLTGYTGLLSLGTGGFMGVGAPRSFPSVAGPLSTWIPQHLRTDRRLTNIRRLGAVEFLSLRLIVFSHFPKGGGHVFIRCAPRMTSTNLRKLS
jgi:hypothetical protein